MKPIHSVYILYTSSVPVVSVHVCVCWNAAAASMMKTLSCMLLYAVMSLLLINCRRR